VAMAHPDIEQAVVLRIGAVLDLHEEGGMAMGTHFGIAEFAHIGALDLAAQLCRHGLHTIADAEHGHAQFKYALRYARCFIFVNRIRAAGKNDAGGIEFTDEIIGDIPRMQFTVDIGFTHAARDELRVLGAEIENQDFCVHMYRDWRLGARGQDRSFQVSLSRNAASLVTYGLPRWLPR